MILDNENLFSDQQAITDTANSTNIIDFGATGTPPIGDSALGRDVADGEPVPLLIQVTEDFATLDSLQVIVQTDDNSSFSSATDIGTSADIDAADLLAGKEFGVNFMPGDVERYVRVRYVVTGTTATAGKVTAGIVADRQTNK